MFGTRAVDLHVINADGDPDPAAFLCADPEPSAFLIALWFTYKFFFFSANWKVYFFGG